MDAKYALGEPRLMISRANLLHNARVLRQRLLPGTDICAIVKADAYGHGAGIVADALANIADGPEQKPAVEQLAVATIEEAVQLPDSVGLPITVLRQIENVFLGRQRFAIEHAIVKKRVTLTIATRSAAADLARIAMKIGRRVDVQVMVDSGLTRCGTRIDALPDLLRRIESLSALRLTSLATHFANSEIAHDPYTIEQLRKFMLATDVYVESKQGKVTRHAANSGGVFFTPRAHLDMVRPGISLYGIDPTGRPNVDRALKPVMKWTAPLIGIHDVKAGTAVGYGQTFVAPRDLRVGLVPIGYADGYLRSLSDKGVMLIGDSRCPVIGRISMDLTTIDLANAPHAHIGELITIVDDDPLSPASAYEISRLADTIPYELFTRIGPRVKRLAVDPTDVDLPSAEEIEQDDFESDETR